MNESLFIRKQVLSWECWLSIPTLVVRLLEFACSWIALFAAENFFVRKFPGMAISQEELRGAAIGLFGPNKGDKEDVAAMVISYNVLACEK